MPTSEALTTNTDREITAISEALTGNTDREITTISEALSGSTDRLLYEKQTSSSTTTTIVTLSNVDAHNSIFVYDSTMYAPLQVSSSNPAFDLYAGPINVSLVRENDIIIFKNSQHEYKYVINQIGDNDPGNNDYAINIKLTAEAIAKSIAFPSTGIPRGRYTITIVREG